MDRHLLGLKLTAAENGIETPGLFTDTAFSRSMHFRLSSSQVHNQDCIIPASVLTNNILLQVPVSNHRTFLNFGAVVEDGYGVCYNPCESEILLSVSSWHHCSETDSQLMASRLHSSLTEMRDLLVSTGRTRGQAKL